MTYKVQKIRIMISADNGMTRLGSTICPYELPLVYMQHGQDLVDIEGPVADIFEVESIPGEVERLKQQYGPSAIFDLFGPAPDNTVESAVTQAVKKQEVVNGSKNTSKSKDRASTEARV